MNASYTLHDVSKFPIVRLRPKACVPGFGSTWGHEMTALVDEGKSFVIIFEPEAMAEEPADFRLRGTWFKQHRNVLAAHCAGMICVISSEEKRLSLENDLQKRSRGFGVPYIAAASMVSAEGLAQVLLDSVV